MKTANKIMKFLIIIAVMMAVVQYPVQNSLITQTFALNTSPPSSIGIQNSNLQIIENTTYKIITTESFLADFVKNIVGNLFQVTPIVTGTEDPHSFTPKASDITLINSASLFVIFGIVDVDGWAQTIIDSKPSTLKVITVANLTQDASIDPLIGSGGGGLNPHIWMDPMWINSTLLTRLYNGLLQVDPSHQSFYAANLASYRIQLAGLIQRVNANATILNNAGIQVIEYHPAFFYLLRYMNLTRLATVETVEDQEPSAKHILDVMKIINRVTSNNHTVILIQNMNLANTTTWQISQDTGIKISYLAALTGNYGWVNFVSYIQMIDYDLVSLTHPVSAPPAVSGFQVVSVIILFVPITMIVLDLRKKTNTK